MKTPPAVDDEMTRQPPMINRGVTHHIASWSVILQVTVDRIGTCPSTQASGAFRGHPFKVLFDFICCFVFSNLYQFNFTQQQTRVALANPR